MNEVMDELSVNTIRTLAMDAVQQANSGHQARRWHWRSPICPTV
jgi:transketolase